jgi:hypothetical protein
MASTAPGMSGVNPEVWPVFVIAAVGMRPVAVGPVGHKPRTTGPGATHGPHSLTRPGRGTCATDAVEGYTLTLLMPTRVRS